MIIKNINNFIYCCVFITLFVSKFALSDLKNCKHNENICNKLEINIISTPSKPNKEEYIYGKDLKLSYEEKQLMKSFITEEIQKFPALPNDLKALFN